MSKKTKPKMPKVSEPVEVDAEEFAPYVGSCYVEARPIVMFEFHDVAVAEQFAWFVRGAWRGQIGSLVRRINGAVELSGDFWRSANTAHQEATGLMRYFMDAVDGRD